jgi:hypothetical protein
MSSELSIEGAKLILRSQTKEQLRDTNQSVTSVPRKEIRSLLLSNERLLVQVDANLIQDAFDLPYSLDSDLSTPMTVEDSLFGGLEEDFAAFSYENPGSSDIDISWPPMDWNEAYMKTSRDIVGEIGYAPVASSFAQDGDISLSTDGGEEVSLISQSVKSPCRKIDVILNRLDSLLV